MTEYMRCPDCGNLVRIGGERDPNWPEGFYWSEADERPVFRGLPQRDGVGAAPQGVTVAPVPNAVPHLDRAVELLWEAGHPRVAEALRDEVLRLTRPENERG